MFIVVMVSFYVPRPSTNGPERCYAEETLSSGVAMSRHIVAIFSITWEMSDIQGKNTPRRQRDGDVGERSGIEQTLSL